jgi:hypothetical protein
MGKTRQVQEQPGPQLFPFHLLTGWIKPSAELEPRRRCQSDRAEILYTCEHYLDMLRAAALAEQGMPERAAVDQVWSEALIEQLAGTYRQKGATSHCQHCLHQILALHSGESEVLLRLFPIIILEKRFSLLFGNTLQMPQDEGVPFTTFTTVTTLEEVAQQLRGEIDPLRLHL